MIKADVKENDMRQIKIVSLITIGIATFLFYIGYCDWDLYIYIGCMVCVFLTLWVYHRLEKKYIQHTQENYEGSEKS